MADASHAGRHRVLLTGVTGFLGKVVLDELLRRRDQLGIEHIDVTVRAPDPGSASSRFRREVAMSPALDAHPESWTKDVRIVCGDCVVQL